MLGGVSPQLSELTGAGKAWSLAGNLAGPSFYGWPFEERISGSSRATRPGKISFEKAVTQAFGEVSIVALGPPRTLAKAYAGATQVR